jgi:hypothetical protein
MLAVIVSGKYVSISVDGPLSREPGLLYLSQAMSCQDGGKTTAVFFCQNVLVLAWFLWFRARVHQGLALNRNEATKDS